MKLIVGVGNPGARYDRTRHNVGFDVVDQFAKRWGFDLSTERFHGWFCLGDFAGERVAMMKPTTFVNKSGRAVLAAGRFYKLELEDLLVVTDDLALPLGRLRMRASGSSGGHNGLQDVIDRLGTNAWGRLRIGIGGPLGGATSHVLGRFSEREEEIMRRSRERATDAVECWIEHGVDLAMTRFNGEPPSE